MNLEAGLETLRQRTANVRYRPRVVCIEGLEPLRVAAGTMPELVTVAGGSYPDGPPAAASPEWTWEQVAAYAPEVILVMPLGCGLEPIRNVLPTLTRQPTWSTLPAVQNRRVYAVDGTRFGNHPGQPLVPTAEVLAALIQPGRCASLLPPGCSFRVDVETTLPAAC